MANSKRRENYTDRNGNMMIPANVDGGQFEEHFITTPKLLALVGIFMFLAFIIYSGSEGEYGLIRWLIVIGVWLFISSLLTRYVIFEEKFYYRMYKDLQKYETTSPALFWEISSIKDTDEGAIITYSDAKIAIMVKVERDTITGKGVDFQEMHYDAISDFYRDIVLQNYSFIQMNIMEQAGKDPRLSELSKIIYKSDNPNIVKLMEMEIGHIKNITHKSLYESDYFIFYTQELSKMDNIIGDISESLFKLLDGAYIGFTILNSREIVDFVKEEYGVNYFNYTEASLLMYNGGGTNIKPYNITGLVWADGEEQVLTPQENIKLRNLTSGVIKETISVDDMSLKKTLYRKEEKDKIGIDFDSLSRVSVNKQQEQGIGQQEQQGLKSMYQPYDDTYDEDDDYIDL